jgi:zinc transporter, ZIP family
MLELILAATLTAVATGLGAVPVAILGTRTERVRPALLAFAGGVMTVAAVVGLVLPAFDQGTPVEIAAGTLVGVAFLIGVRRRLGASRAHIAGRASISALLVFTVLFAHSLPEGFAIGTAYASSTEGLAAFVVIAIAIQNIPEGTGVAIPMEAAGYSAPRQFWAAVATSAPQPIGAVVAYLVVDQVRSLLPFSFGFAAGAMLALVALVLMPEAVRADRSSAIAGAAAGAAVMLALSLALSV